MIFRALTDEKELVQWMPKSAKIDARVGGEYEFKLYSATTKVETTVKGKILELVPNKKLVYSFASSREEPGFPPSVLTWTLEEESGGKTLVKLVHSKIAGDSARYFLGWGHYLDRLVAYLTKFRANPES